jgi:hypothetical protein
MTETRDHTQGYEPPRIEASATIDAVLIGGAVSSNVDVPESAAFTHI